MVAGDYYKVLGIRPAATEREVRDAYRRLARRYHPDVSSIPGAEARFKEVGAAYVILSNPDLRRAYDRAQLWLQRPAPDLSRRPARPVDDLSGSPVWPDARHGSRERTDDLVDLTDMFGRPRRRSGVRRVAPNESLFEVLWRSWV